MVMQRWAGRPGITFDVTLDVPWNAPEAVMHLHSDGVVGLDLDTVPGVLGLTGWRPEAAVIRVLQGRCRAEMSEVCAP